MGSATTPSVGTSGGQTTKVYNGSDGKLNLTAIRGGGVLVHVTKTNAVFFSPDYKRLGDYAAGTVVIRERPRTAPRLEAAAPGGPSNLPSPEDLYAIRNFLDRRQELAPETRADYARRLALAFGRLLGYPLDQVAAGPEQFLQWLVDEATRRHGG